MKRIATFALLFSLAVSSASAVVYEIKPDGTGDFPTIQAAIAAAVDTDEIVLHDGVYFGPGNANLDFLGKAITVRSLSGNPPSAVMDGLFGIGPAVTFENGEGLDSILEGITITRFESGPIDAPIAGAIAIRLASPTIRNVVVRGNASGGVQPIIASQSNALFENCTVELNQGGGISITGNSANFPGPTVTGSVIEANTGLGSFGGGLFISGAATVERTQIVGNDRGGVSAFGPVTMRECLVADNISDSAGSSVYFWGGSLLIERSTIAHNQAGGIFSEFFANGTITLDRTILWGNCGLEASLSSGTTLQWSCSNVDTSDIVSAGTVIGDEFSPAVDPQFCAPRPCGDPVTNRGLYGLRNTSPMINYPSCGQIGVLGEMCTISVEAQSWGRVKSLYR